MTARSYPDRLAAHAVLILAVAVTFVPLVWMFGMSLKPPQLVFTDPLNPLPLAPTLENYANVFRTANVARQFVNSVVFAGGVTLGQLAIAVPAAYFFSRHDSRAANLLFAAFLLTLPVPFVVFYVPNYILMSRLDLLNTYPGMILPQIASAYGIFLLRQHFKSFPQSIIEAARIDGAAEWTIIWRVVLPANRAAIAALAIFVFINTWNEFVWPLLIARDPEMHILTVGVAQFASGEGGIQWSTIMAAAALATLPTLLAYLFIRRQILNVILEGAVKG
ncbi:carbohydrate ABC transporter permease [Rubrobacter taiwanensis]|uniref:Carbohydrate ABC transporter permease n=1 Tax=Rubrobacter taiwanensis TaxID=185139 RepID=A0A4R1BQC4_9ACTN|nr:carbohydrate ABC transporter permease [Rubrobacter taiwanensis]TCJ19929.1 carbohydrate ABC transporter permease [Rubrobacter taiwanensis]